MRSFPSIVSSASYQGCRLSRHPIPLHKRERLGESVERPDCQQRPALLGGPPSGNEVTHATGDGLRTGGPRAAARRLYGGGAVAGEVVEGIEYLVAIQLDLNEIAPLSSREVDFVRRARDAVDFLVVVKRPDSIVDLGLRQFGQHAQRGLGLIVAHAHTLEVIEDVRLRRSGQLDRRIVVERLFTQGGGAMTG